MRNVDFSLRIVGFNVPKINCIKFLRAATGLGLKDAKDLFENLNESRASRRLRVTTEQFGTFVALKGDPDEQAADFFEFWSPKLVPMEDSTLINLTRPAEPTGFTPVVRTYAPIAAE